MLAANARAPNHRLCADAALLPLADQSVDIIVSNLMLQNCADTEAVFREARRILRAPGLFLFSTLGPDTLKELRRAWARIDRQPHVHDHDDMHILGNMLVGAGFREPVMDVEMLTINYSAFDSLLSDLRALAANNFARDRARGLLTPRRRDQFLTELEDCRTGDGKLPATVELITGQAWTGAPNRGVPLEDGVAHFPISRLK